jgi:predicted nuclease of restriction endonuclease-like (RecB) superfamily
MKAITQKKDYNVLLDSIGELLEKARKNIFYQINQTLVNTYWEIGKRMVEFEQTNKESAEYGSKLFEILAKDLRQRYGKGFSRSNVIYMRLFYIKYSKSQTLSDQLGWSHYVELLMIENDLERSFYEKQCINEKWSVRELKRQKSSALFQRIALSKDNKIVLTLAHHGQVIETAADVVKDPYVLEFLGFPEEKHYSERHLEQRIIDNLQKFLLELVLSLTKRTVPFQNNI